MMITVKMSPNDNDEDIRFVKFVLKQGFEFNNCPQDNCKECSHRWGCLAVKNAIEYLKRK